MTVTTSPRDLRTAEVAFASRRTGFREAVLFEWTKLTTTRSTVWTLIAVCAVMPIMAVFVAATGSLQPDDTVLGASLTGAGPSLVIGAAFGALVMTGEYRSGMIRATLTATPRRGTVLAAKATVISAVLFAGTLPAATVAHVIGVGLLDADRYAPGDPWPALVGVGVAMAVIGMLGLAIATIVRHSAAAIGAVIGVILLPAFVAPLLGDLEPWVGGASPMAALQKMTQSSDAAPEIAGSLGAWPSLAVMAGYTAVLLLAGARVFRSRDA